MSKNIKNIKLHELVANGAWQERTGQRVGQEIFLCLSSLVYELAQDAKYAEELADVIYPQPDYESAAYDHAGRAIVDAEAYCNEHNLEPYEHEIFEHWAISDWLSEKLQAKGEAVLRDWNGMNIWGRTTTGQSIYMDSVINQIYFELALQYTKQENLMKELGMK